MEMEGAGLDVDAADSQLPQSVEKEIHLTDAVQQHRDSGLPPEGLEHQQNMETNHPSAVRNHPLVVSVEAEGLQSVMRAGLQAMEADQSSSAVPVTQPQVFREASGAVMFTAPVMSLTMPLNGDTSQSSIVTVTMAQPQQPTPSTSQTFTTLQPVVSINPLLAAQPAISIVSMENGIVTVRSSDTGSAEDRTTSVQPANRGSGTDGTVTAQLMDVAAKTDRIVAAQSVAAGLGTDKTEPARGKSADPAAGVDAPQSHLHGSSLAGSELVEISSADVDSLVRSEIVEDAGHESESMDDVEESEQASSAGSSSSRWRRTETLKLVELYKEYQGFFEDKHYKKKTVWAMLAARLAKGSKSKAKYTSAQVCNRWKNLTKLYRDCVDNLKRTGPWVSKCQYFDELDSVYNLVGADRAAGPQPQIFRSSRSSLKNRRLQRLAKREKKTSTAGSFVAIAPKRPLPQVGVAPSASSDVSSIVILAENSGSPVPSSSTVGGEKGFSSVVQAVQALHEDQKRIDAWKLDRLEKMHKEKMRMFARFLEVLKEQKQ